MAECVDLMAAAMEAASSGSVRIPPRLFTPLVDHSASFGLMPGSAREPAVYGAKAISLHPDNPRSGRPAIQGFVALFDHDTGAPIAIVEGSEITALRTAAASGLATRLLARADASSHGVFGTGVQARTHLEAIAVARPIEKVRIWGRDPLKAKALADEERERTGVDARAVEDPREAAACDVVSTVTATATPVLRGAWVEPGCHVNLVGCHTPKTREADSDLIAKARVYADLLESLFNEGGDVLIPIEEGRIDRSWVRGEIGQVSCGEIEGRTSEEEITVYKSLGITAQDLFAAHAVLEKAQAQGRGTAIPWSGG